MTDLVQETYSKKKKNTLQNCAITLVRFSLSIVNSVANCQASFLQSIRQIRGV